MTSDAPSSGGNEKSLMRLEPAQWGALVAALIAILLMIVASRRQSD